MGFPADFHFSMDLSGQVGHYTVVYTEEVVVPICSEQVTLEEIAEDLGDTADQVRDENVLTMSTEMLVNNNRDPNDQDDLVNVKIVSNEKFVDNNDLNVNHLQDGLEELSEPSPIRENSLSEEL